MQIPSLSEWLFLLEEHEKTVGALYDVFSVHIPCLQDMWKRLAEEERVHASWLAALRKRYDDGDCVWRREGFNTTVLHTSIEYIRRRMDEFSTAGGTALRALSIGLDLETSMIEKSFFFASSNDPEEAKEIFRKLAEETAGHKRLIEAQLVAERERQTGPCGCKDGK